MGLSGLASLALLAAMAALGVGILHRLAPFLDAFEQWIYGSVLGTVLCSFLLLILAIPLGLSRLLVLGLGVAAATRYPAVGEFTGPLKNALGGPPRMTGIPGF